MRATALILLAACGTDPKTIEVAIPGTQTLVTEKVDGGVWTELSGTFDRESNTTTYRIEIGDELELVAVCRPLDAQGAWQFVAGELFATSEDAEVTLGSWHAPNCEYTGYEQLGDDAITVTGTSAAAMQIAIGNRPVQSVTAGNSFTYRSNPGVHDLIAYSNSKLLIDRGRTFDGSPLAQLDVEQNGKEILEIDVGELLTTNLTVEITSSLQTRSGATFSWSSPARLFAPAQLLEPGDQQRFQLKVYDPDAPAYRWIEVSDPGQFPAETLLTPIAYAMRHTDHMGMTWSAIPDFFTTASVMTIQNGERRSTQSVTASKLWLDRHGPNALDFDLDVDGYDPSWTTDDKFFLDIKQSNPGRVTATSYIPFP